MFYLRYPLEHNHIGQKDNHATFNLKVRHSMYYNTNIQRKSVITQGAKNHILLQCCNFPHYSLYFLAYIHCPEWKSISIFRFMQPKQTNRETSRIEFRDNVKLPDFLITLKYVVCINHKNIKGLFA